MGKISRYSSASEDDRFFQDGRGDMPDGGAGAYGGDARPGGGTGAYGGDGRPGGGTGAYGGDGRPGGGTGAYGGDGQSAGAYGRDGRPDGSTGVYERDNWSGSGAGAYAGESRPGGAGTYGGDGWSGSGTGQYEREDWYGSDGSRAAAVNQSSMRARRNGQYSEAYYKGDPAREGGGYGYLGGSSQIPPQGYHGEGQIPPQGYSNGGGQVPPQSYSGGGQIPPQGYSGGGGGTGAPPQGGGSGGRGRRRRSRFGDVVSGLLMLVALAVFLYSGYTLYGFYKEYKKGTDEYDNLEDNFVIEQGETENLAALEDEKALQEITGREVATVQENGEEKTVPVMYNPIDFAELKAVNEDIVGWLKIRALDISYPIVQAEDNDFYLHRTFEKTDNFAGCIFMNCDNKDDLTDQNTIIYGHNMKNGSMFGKLKKYNEEETFNKSGYFWIFAPDLIYQYQIFSAMTVSKVGLTYQTFFTDEEYDRFVATAFENSVVDNTGMKVTRDDRIVTLSTCTGDDATRFVVMGRLAQVYAAKR